MRRKNHINLEEMAAVVQREIAGDVERMTAPAHYTENIQ